MTQTAPASNQQTPSLASMLWQANSGPSLTWSGATIDARSLLRRVDALAPSLDGLAGQRVMVVGGNVPAYVVALFATWRAGAVAVPLSNRVRRYELTTVLRDAEPRAVLAVEAPGHDALADVLAECAHAAVSVDRLLTLDAVGSLTHGTRRSAPAEPAPLPTGAATILYTAGTTGDAKGVIESHEKWLATAESFAAILGPYADALCGYVIPASHSFGLACLLASLRAGGHAVLLDSAQPGPQLLTALRDGAVRVVHGSPALFTRLVHDSGEPPTWETGFVAGAVCPPQLVATLAMHGARMLGQYGLTEVGSVTACHLDDPDSTRFQTVGQPLRGYRVRAVPLPSGEASEIQVRSDFRWPRLLTRAWSPAEVTADGWLRTGDLGSVDTDGNLRITGRIKHVVHTGGFSVQPAEVEGFLQTHPDVAAAAVVGMPHSQLGEVLAAFIVPRRGAAWDRQAFVRFCRAGIASYKVPHRVHVVAELPLLPSGKPDRRELERTALEGAI